MKSKQSCFIQCMRTSYAAFRCCYFHSKKRFVSLWLPFDDSSVAIAWMMFSDKGTQKTCFYFNEIKIYPLHFMVSLHVGWVATGRAPNKWLLGMFICLLLLSSFLLFFVALGIMLLYLHFSIPYWVSSAF